jgi:hypothetical protein
VTKWGAIDLHPQIINMVFNFFLPLLTLDCETWLHDKMKIVHQATRSQKVEKQRLQLWFSLQQKMKC